MQNAEESETESGRFSPTRCGVARFPTDRAAYAALSLFAICYPVLLDRYGMIDNANYIQYFVEAKNADWLTIFTTALSPVQLIVLLFTEEILWRCWTSVLTLFFEPAAAVHVTIVAINALVCAAFAQVRHRALSVLLWILIPFGFAVIGLYQIRQGLAFGLWIYLGLHKRKLVLATLLAALVHTTFFALLPMAAIASVRKVRPLVRIVACTLLSFLAAFLGRTLFETFGGRRVAVYADEDFSLSYNFLVMLLIFSVVPAYGLISKGSAFGATAKGEATLESYCVTFLGLLIFLAVCFFLFPLGDARLPYIAVLGLIPLLANVTYVRSGHSPPRKVEALLVFAPVFAFLAYLCVKAAFDGRYLCLVLPNCTALSIG